MIRRPSLTAFGLLLVAIGGPVSYALGQGAYSTGDEPMHLDYAYQLWHGRLPRFHAGTQLVADVGFHAPMQVQWVAHHPPLFYALLAPIVGPLADAGHVIGAAYAARAVMVALAVATVFATRWSCRALLPQQAATAEVAALLMALSSWFPRQGGSVYNDMPALLAVSVALGFWARLLRDGRRRDLIGLCLALAAGSLVRFAVVPVAAVLVAAVFVHGWSSRRSWRRAVLHPTCVVLSVLAASGWWWARNLHLTGNLQGAQTAFWRHVSSRYDARPLTDVLWHDGFWTSSMQQFFTTYFLTADRWTHRAAIGNVVLFAVPLLIGAIAVGVGALRQRDGTAATIWGGLLLAICVVTAAQVSYAMSGGSMFPRYLFALMPFVCPLMAACFTWLPGGRLLMCCWLALRIPAFAVEVWATLHRHTVGPQAPTFGSLSWLAYGVAVAGTLLVAAAVLSCRRRADPAVPRPQACAAVDRA